jgi:hypothetical protein
MRLQIRDFYALISPRIVPVERNKGFFGPYIPAISVRTVPFLQNKYQKIRYPSPTPPSALKISTKKSAIASKSVTQDLLEHLS